MKYILLLSTFIYSLNSFAILTGPGSCANIMREIAKAHDVEYKSRQTIASLHVLNRFKDQFILDELYNAARPKVAPNEKNINVDHLSSFTKRDSVASRIEAILKFYQSNFHNRYYHQYLNVDDNQMMAVTLKADQVDDFFEKMFKGFDETAKLHAKENIRFFDRDGSFNTEGVVNALLGMMIYSYASKYQAGTIQEAEAVLGALGGFLFYQGFGAGSFAKELFFNHDLTYKAKLKRFSKEIQKMNKGGWKYLSMDMKMPRLNAETYFGRESEKVVNHDFINRSPTMLKFFLTHSYSSRFTYEDLQLKWLGLDFLFHHDPESNTKMMTMVVRSAAKKPKYKMSKAPIVEDSSDTLKLDGKLPSFLNDRPIIKTTDINEFNEIFGIDIFK